MDEEVRVIKKHQIRPAGSRQVGPGCAGAGPAGRRPGARVVEATGASAGIEVTCVCGRKIHLQIDCGAPGGEAASAPQQADLEVAVPE